MENYAQFNKHRFAELGVVCRLYGVAAREAHTAVGDCQMIANLLNVWMREATSG